MATNRRKRRLQKSVVPLNPAPKAKRPMAKRTPMKVPKHVKPLSLAARQAQPLRGQRIVERPRPKNFDLTLPLLRQPSIELKKVPPKNIRPQDECPPYSRDMVFMPYGYNYFDFAQRPTLLMNAFAREGWDVHWINPPKRTSESGELPEHGIHFWNKEEANGSILQKAGSVKWVMHPHCTIPRGASADRGLWVFDLCDDFKEQTQNAIRNAREADVVFCTADSLQKKLASTVNAHLLPNGVDYELFAGEEGDPELVYRGIPRPRIGYMGALAYWVDWYYIDFLAQTHPKWSIVLIGFHYGIKRIPVERPNIYYAGYVPYTRLPLYLKGLDVGIIPFLEGEIGRGCNPCKMYQYWACGLPTVASNMPEVRKYHEPIAFTSRSKQQFVNMVEKALYTTAEDRDLCRQEAQKNTWDIRAQKAEEILDQIFVERGVTASGKKIPVILPGQMMHKARILFVNASPLIEYGIIPSLQGAGYENLKLFHIPRDVPNQFQNFRNLLSEFRPHILFSDSFYHPGVRMSEIGKMAQGFGAKFVYWMIEDPLSTYDPAKFSIFTEPAKRADLVLTCATESVKAHRKKLGTRCEPFLFAYSPEGMEPLKRPQGPSHNGVFVANCYDWDGRYQQQEIIASLANELDIEIYGSWWNRSTFYRELGTRVHDKLHYSKTFAALDSAKIVLGAHIVMTSASQTSMRTFEAMGNGSFYLTFDTLSHHILFTEGTHYVSWDSQGDLRQKFLYYLEHEKEREEIAQAAREKILAEHTYAHRWRVMEPYIKEWL